MPKRAVEKNKRCVFESLCEPFVNPRTAGDVKERLARSRLDPQAERVARLGAKVDRAGVLKIMRDFSRRWKGFDRNPKIYSRTLDWRHRFERQFYPRDQMWGQDIEHPVRSKGVEHAPRGVNTERLRLAQTQETRDMV